MRRLVSATLLTCASCAWILAATEPDQATRRWWSHVRALADDRMRGRDTGSDGYRRAAAYVVDQFTRAGLDPAGDSAGPGQAGFYQRVPLHGVRFVADRSTLTL